MKIFVFTIILAFIISGCFTPTEKPNHSDTKNNNSEINPESKFFEYDEIDHYFIDFDDKDLLELIEKKNIITVRLIKK
jgi:PBP1b-binding outer membrane lipoprotein LpoB